MAKAKKQKQTKMQTKSKTSKNPTLPNGYRVIGRAPNWEPEQHPVIEGERGEAREVTLDAGTKKERTIRNMIVQDDTLGPVTVWESSMLKDLFDQTEPGDVIRIEYLGLGQAKRGQQPPKLFACAVKED